MARNASVDTDTMLQFTVLSIADHAEKKKGFKSDFEVIILLTYYFETAVYSYYMISGCF